MLYDATGSVGAVAGRRAGSPSPAISHASPFASVLRHIVGKPTIQQDKVPARSPAAFQGMSAPYRRVALSITPLPQASGQTLTRR